METLSRGCQLEGLDPVRPQGSQVFRNLQSALPKTGQVGRNLILLSVFHRTLRRTEDPGSWFIKKTRLRDRLLETNCTTTGNLDSYYL